MTKCGHLHIAFRCSMFMQMQYKALSLVTPSQNLFTHISITPFQISRNCVSTLLMNSVILLQAFNWVDNIVMFKTNLPKMRKQLPIEIVFIFYLYLA